MTVLRASIARFFYRSVPNGRDCLALNRKSMAVICVHGLVDLVVDMCLSDQLRMYRSLSALPWQHKASAESLMSAFVKPSRGIIAIPTDHKQPRVGLFYCTCPRGEGCCSVLAICRMLSAEKKRSAGCLQQTHLSLFLFCSLPFYKRRFAGRLMGRKEER